MLRIFKLLPLVIKRGLQTATKETKVGIIGCGNVGNAVANNLARNGHPVVAMFDISQARMDAMPKGIEKCSNARQVAEAVDIIITGLPKPHNLKAAAEGDEGILSGLSKDKIWIDHSTTDCQQTKMYSEEAKKKNAYVLEAPITGGYEALKKGQMVTHIGGDSQVLEAVKPILDMSYKEIFYVGEIGSAMIVKVVSNMLVGVNLMAMTEVLMLAKRAGIDLETFWNGIRLSAGNSFTWETAGPIIFNGTYDPKFTLGLLCKDLQLGFEMAKTHKVPMDINQLALSMHRRAQYQFGDDVGCYMLPKMTEIALKESLNIPGFEDWSYDNKIVNGSLQVAHKIVKET